MRGESYAVGGGVSCRVPVRDGGGWLVSGRRGYLDLAFKISNLADSIYPRYNDLFGKITYGLPGGGRVALRLAPWLLPAPDDWDRLAGAWSDVRDTAEGLLERAQILQAMEEASGGMGAVHTIPVPEGWSAEQAWEAILRGDACPNGPMTWDNIYVGPSDRRPADY